MSEAVVAYTPNMFGGMASAHCSICGRELTNPESIKRGIGPVCSNQGYIGKTEEDMRTETIGQWESQNGICDIEVKWKHIK